MITTSRCSEDKFEDKGLVAVKSALLNVWWRGIVKRQSGPLWIEELPGKNAAWNANSIEAEEVDVSDEETNIQNLKWYLKKFFPD